MKLLLDAGHGGRDPGAGTDSANESEITLDIVLMLRAIIETRYPDWEVLLTRDTDVYLSPDARKRECMKVRPDAFISIHCNAASSISAHGCEVIYREEDDRKLAEAIQAALLDEFVGLRDRGVKSDVGDLKRQLAILSTPGIPSVIVEPAFITNSQDLTRLLSTDKVAWAILKGVLRWKEELVG